MQIRGEDYIETAVYSDNLLRNKRLTQYERSSCRVTAQIIAQRDFGPLEPLFCHTVIEFFAIDLEEYRKKPNSMQIFEEDIAAGLEMIAETGIRLQSQKIPSPEDASNFRDFCLLVNKQYLKEKLNRRYICVA